MRDGEEKKVERLRMKPPREVSLGEGLRLVREFCSLSIGEVAACHPSRSVEWAYRVERDRTFPYDAITYVQAMARALKERMIAASKTSALQEVFEGLVALTDEELDEVAGLVVKEIEQRKAQGKETRNIQ